MTYGADWTFLGYFFKNSAEVVAAVIRVNLPTAPHLSERSISKRLVSGTDGDDSRQLDTANVG